MARYRFKALGGKGETIEGEVEAIDQAAVVERLRQRQQLPLSIQPALASLDARPGSRLVDLLNQPLFERARIRSGELAGMTRELATLLGAGLTVDQSLSFLIDVADGEPQRRLLIDLLERVQGGDTLAAALAHHPRVFSNAYVSLVRAGESGNSLADVLTHLARFLDHGDQLAQQVKSALVYPAILMAMAAMSIIVILTLVVPQFTPLFESAGADLPFLTRLVVMMGDGVRAYGWLALITGLVLAFLFKLQLGHGRGRARIDHMALRLPLIGDLIAKMNTARFARTVGTLLANGVDLPASLSMARETVGNAVLRETLSKTQEAVKEGKRIGETLDRAKVFPKRATHLIAVGERSGDLHGMLLRVADIFDQEVKTTIERLMTLLVPVLTIAVGLVIAIIIGAILTAMLAAYQLPI